MAALYTLLMTARKESGPSKQLEGYFAILAFVIESDSKGTKMNASEPPVLPACWRTPFPEMQSYLFGEPVEEVLASAHVSRDDLRRWRDKGWISFDVDQLKELPDAFVWEIELVRRRTIRIL